MRPHKILTVLDIPRDCDTQEIWILKGALSRRQQFTRGKLVVSVL